jgi:hypothetical protein
MIEKIELDNKTFTKEILDKALFFSLAEGGAMGEPGGILFITDDGKLYHANYVFGDLKHETIKEAFPVIDECRFGLFGIGTTVPIGWTYISLGFGNHLIVKDNCYTAFEPLIAGYDNPGELYQHWVEKALESLSVGH